VCGGSNQPVADAVRTGETLVTLGEGPTVGERVAGDIVNPASRLQSLAPEGSVIVGEPRERVTRHLVDYAVAGHARMRRAEPLAAVVAPSV
jgi:class 3 adenylate cyclase